MVALALPVWAASAAAENQYGQNVDDDVAAQAEGAAPATPLAVIVFGRGLGAITDPELSPNASLPDGAVAGTVTAAELARLAAEPNVAYIAPDAPVVPDAVAARPTFPLLASLYPTVDGATQAWAEGYTGAGVGIAVVDSGLDRQAVFGNAAARRVAASAGNDHGADRVGHGSLVTSVAAGQSDDGRFSGVAPGASVVSYNVAHDGTATTSDVLLGLEWVLANQQRYGIRVVNLSLGETVPSSYLSSALDSMVEQVWNAGIVVVASSGNLGPGTVDYAPGNDPFAITVGATDVNGTAATSDDALTPWSSYGVTPDGFVKPEIVAPGRSVVGAVAHGSTLAKAAPAANWVAPPTYLTISGTSFSAPQVAGAAAVLLQEHPGWTPSQVKWVLESTARPVAGSTAGSLDLAAAVAYAGTPPDADAGIPQTTFGLPGWVSSVLKGNQASWSQASWTQASWTQASWSQASWTQASWTASSWGG